MLFNNHIHSFFMRILKNENIRSELFGSIGFVNLLEDTSQTIYSIVDTILGKDENHVDCSDFCSLVVVKESHEYVFSYRIAKALTPVFADVLYPVEESLVYKIHTELNSINCGDITEILFSENIAYEKWIEQSDIKSVMSIPLWFKNEVFGYVATASTRKDAFDDRAMEKATMIAGLVNAAFIDGFNSLINAIRAEEHKLLIESGEAKLRMLQECQSLIFKNIKEAIILFNTNSTIIDCNPAAETTFGYSREEMIGNDFSIFVDNSKKKILNEITDAIVRELEWHSEIPLKKKDGTKLYYDIMLSPLMRDNGTVVAVISLGRDITETYKNQKNQKINLELFKQAVEQTDDIIVITTGGLEDPEPEIIFANKAFEKMTGYSREEVIGKTPRILQCDKTDRNTLNEVRETLSNGKSFCGKTINKTKQGEEYEVEWSVSPVKNEEGKTTHFVSVQRPVKSEKVV